MTHHRTKTERSKVVITWVQQWQIGTSLWLLPASWEQTGIWAHHQQTRRPGSEHIWNPLQYFVSICLSQMGGFCFHKESRQGRSIMLKKKREVMWILFFQFKLFRGSSRRQQFESWVIKWENRGVSHEYSNMHTPQELLNILVEIMTE